MSRAGRGCRFRNGDHEHVGTLRGRGVKGQVGYGKLEFDHAVTERFVRAEHRNLVLADTDAAHLLGAFDTWTPPALDKWIDRTSPRPPDYG